MKPADLWLMPPYEFNKWRRENDLKALFIRFEKALPHFQEWLSDFDLTVDFILQTDQPGQFFYWEKDVFVVKETNEDFDKYFFVIVEDEAHEKQILKVNERDNYEQKKYRPYLIWAKEKLKAKKVINIGHNGESETFRYDVLSAANSPEFCSATLNVGVTVLKLGGTTVDGWVNFLRRNLDFVNLDFLHIEGGDSWSRESRVFYSSCRNIKVTNAEGSFVNFFQCEFEKLYVFNSEFYGFEFSDCEIFKAEFENTSLKNISFKNCPINFFSFYRVECENIIYDPTKSNYFLDAAGSYEQTKENYKRFRLLYQINGLREEAAEAYYYERLYELKYLWKSLEMKQAIKSIYNGFYKYGFSKLIFHFKQFFKALSYSFSYTVWGFGEKPIRTLSASIFVLVIYALIYYFSSIETLSGSFINSLYLSVIMFTTLGFGDYVPLQSGIFKLVVSSEALMGLFIAGLFIAGYANKSNF